MQAAFHYDSMLKKKLNAVVSPAYVHTSVGAGKNKKPVKFMPDFYIKKNNTMLLIKHRVVHYSIARRKVN